MADQVLAQDPAQIPNPKDSQIRICKIPLGHFVWLCVFCITGVGLGMCWEFLELHGGPAKAQTFITCFIGYWTQVLVGGAYALSQPEGFSGTWSRMTLVWLFISALFDGGAQSLNYVGQYEGGQMLFTIFHASVTLWTAVIATFVLRVRVTLVQWLGVLLVVGGLFATAIPQHIEAQHSYFWAVVASATGSFCLAASYPFSELVFKSSPNPPSEESACMWGSLINAVLFTIWTAAYTAPKWHELVAEPINHSPHPSVELAYVGYAMYGVMVGLHSLSFWKSVNHLGTVPTAVSKGAQQAGVFVFSHIIFCNYDSAECIDSNYGHSKWNKAQKGVAFVLCATGVAIYSLAKYHEKRPDTEPLAEGLMYKPASQSDDRFPSKTANENV